MDIKKSHYSSPVASKLGDMRNNIAQAQPDHPLFVWCNFCLELETFCLRDTIG